MLLVAALLCLGKATGIERLAGRGLASQYAKSVAKEVKRMERLCGNCVFCLIGIDGERVCSLAGQEYVTKDKDGDWITGRLVHPEDKCIYPESSSYVSFALVDEKSEFPEFSIVGPRNLWKASVDRALREAKSLQAFCKGHTGYSQYEVVLEDLIRALVMDAVTAANM